MTLLEIYHGVPQPLTPSAAYDPRASSPPLILTSLRLCCDGLLHYKFIIQFAGKRNFKIGEPLAKLQAKWLIVSYTQFALDVCPQRCRTRRISKISCM